MRVLHRVNNAVLAGLWRSEGYESLVELGRAESGENLRYGYLGRCDGGECDDYEIDYDDDGVHGCVW
ncbi:hypothetical protein Tco_0100165 [Tanacetum coccineum]